MNSDARSMLPPKSGAVSLFSHMMMHGGMLLSPGAKSRMAHTAPNDIPFPNGINAHEASEDNRESDEQLAHADGGLLSSFAMSQSHAHSTQHTHPHTASRFSFSPSFVFSCRTGFFARLMVANFRGR